MTATIAISDAVRDENLLGAALGNPAPWETWIAVLKASFHERLSRHERRAFDAVAGGRKPPSERVRELIAIVGRGGGKSRMAALIAAYVATCIDHSAQLAPGETGLILILAMSQAEAGIVFGYVEAFLRASPILAARIEGVTATEIRLRGNIVVAVHSNSFRTIRGRTLICTIFDEAAMWRSDESANPDTEVYTSVLPSLIRTRGLLVIISTGYRRAGLLYGKWKANFGNASDPGVLVVRGSTADFNPTFDRARIEAAKAADPEAAEAEWMGGFRSDLADFVSAAVLERCVGPYDEIPPLQGCRYVGFVDPSGGAQDSFCMAIAHRDRESTAIVIDRLEEAVPPFSPEDVVRSYARVLKHYDVRSVMGDRFGGDWVRERFAKAQIGYCATTRVKSDLYQNLLPLLHSGQIVLPNNARLLNQICTLERRTRAGGRDSIDHGPGPSAHDDLSNVAAGVAHLVANCGSPPGMGRW
jgi:hypothetical protein